MTMEEQYNHLTDALMTAFDNALDEIPGNEINALAAAGAIGYLLHSVAFSSDDPGGFVREFALRMVKASEAVRKGTP